MEKEFCTYNQAVALKELGFNEECFKYIYIGDTGNNYDHYLEVEPLKAKKYNEDDLCISQPLKQQVFRWFREKHSLEIILCPDCFNEPSKLLREYKIISIDKSIVLNQYTDQKHWIRKGCFISYEEAENALIDKLIEICKQQDKI